MRRTTSALLTVAILISASPSIAATCWYDPERGEIVCAESGGGDTPPTTQPDPKPRVGKRYVYQTTRAGVGECYYWSNRAGGIDSWNPANDTAIINIVTRTPQCPVNAVPVVDVVATAWAIFRSWPLEAPQVSLQPAGAGITGLPTFLAAPTPAPISHSERLPDGRTLMVRAHVEYLDVSWGDDSIARYQPSGALPYPHGSVTHTYIFKTCTDVYRTTHPSGALCHPTLDRYAIAATFSWSAQYTTNGSWRELGTLNRSAADDYFVDEARGVTIP